MSQALTLARPYARAAFAIARDEKTFADWSQALGFAARIAADPQVATLLGDPRLSRGSRRTTGIASRASASSCATTTCCSAARWRGWSAPCPWPST